MRFLPKFGPRTGLKYVLLAQLALAGLLITTDVIGSIQSPFREKLVLPTGPVSPGDQRREYRTDKPVLRLTEPGELALPDRFPARLTFTKSYIDGIGIVLLLTGAIEEGDADRFERHLAGMNETPALVALHSPGGLVGEAQLIGRQIREANLVTGVTPGASCVSSCPYILAGGLERLVSRRGIVGMHQHYYEQPRLIPVMFAVADIQVSQGETMAFLIEMGVDPSLMIYSLKTPPEEIYALVEDELAKTNIATEIVE
ncbi:hypothetical protein [Primorskyibacter sp. S87]|uniref:COG3904 family protein n=1 Tax=Primorskyibacter sp. S87 TaxID=3415126 RepID=UPI003C7D323B